MKEILEKIVINKSEDDLQEINLKYSRLFYTIAYDISKDSFFSDEVVNDILLYIWNKAKFLCALDYPQSYLCTICYNKAIDYLRKKKRIVYDDDIVLGLTENNNTGTNEKIDNLLSRLNKEQRTIIIMKIAYNMSYDDIAKALRISVKKVRIRLEKAKTYINNLVKEENI